MTRTPIQTNTVLNTSIDKYPLISTLYSPGRPSPTSAHGGQVPDAAEPVPEVPPTPTPTTYTTPTTYSPHHSLPPPQHNTTPTTPYHHIHILSPPIAHVALQYNAHHTHKNTPYNTPYNTLIARPNNTSYYRINTTY